MPHCKYAKKLYLSISLFEGQFVFQVVKRKYQQEYDIAPPITFGGDQVALDIPDDGVQIDSGWEIKPLHKACVSRHVQKLNQ